MCHSNFNSYINRHILLLTRIFIWYLFSIILTTLYGTHILLKDWFVNNGLYKTCPYLNCLTNFIEEMKIFEVLGGIYSKGFTKYWYNFQILISISFFYKFLKIFSSLKNPKSWAIEICHLEKMIHLSMDNFFRKRIFYIFSKIFSLIVAYLTFCWIPFKNIVILLKFLLIII